VSSEIAASKSQRSTFWPARLDAGIARLWMSIPGPVRLVAIAGLGVAAATAVGLLTSANPSAQPAGLAVELRVVLIAVLIAAGLYAQTSKLQARMGGLMIAVGLIASLWLLNGSDNRVVFSVGVVFTGLMPLVVAYLMLSHPTGRLASRTELRFLWLTGGALATLWLLGIVMTLQPPLRTPLLQCGPHCPDNVFSLGSATEAVTAVQIAMVLAWLGLTCGTPVLLARRVRAASAPVRRSVTPVWITATAAAVLLTASMILHTLGLHAWTKLGAAYTGLVGVLPLAILVGLASDRLFMGQALAEFVSELARVPAADPEALMAAALRDPSLKVAYLRRERGTYVDSAGQPVAEPSDSGTAITWIEGERRPVAAVMYNADLAGYERFVQAAGAAALIRLEKTQLEADLKASTTDLASSRVRLMEMAHAERRRLERDLHDGVQQQLVGLRIKLDMAAETIKDDPERGERALASVGRQMDDVLHELRSLARGIYPSLLHECGLREALRAAARSSPAPVAVRAGGIGRCREDLEVAVYFCCLEALQNVVKHAGPEATTMINLSLDGPHLCFGIHDSGIGFDPDDVPRGNGLVNMRDRIEAVGGTLEVTARKGGGTSVRGRVPIH
jgi:signal transduction histidine kinase